MKLPLLAFGSYTSIGEFRYDDAVHLRPRNRESDYKVRISSGSTRKQQVLIRIELVYCPGPNLFLVFILFE